MTKAALPESLVRFSHALVEDAKLRSWFLGLSGIGVSLRRAALRKMSEEMCADNQDPELVAAVAALDRPEVFDAVRDAVRDRCGL